MKAIKVFADGSQLMTIDGHAVKKRASGDLPWETIAPPVYVGDLEREPYEPSPYDGTYSEQ